MPFVVKADDSGGGFVGPSIDDFFPPAVLFEGTPFELNRVTLIRLLVVVVLLIVLVLGTRNWKVVPTRGQAAMEFAINFVRQGIVIDTLGEKDGKRFMPIIMTIFFLTLGLNLTGTIPGLQIASTGLIGQALVMAVISYATFIYAGVRAHNVKYFKIAVWIPGVPGPIKPVIALLEILSTFIIRPITLTLRLTMNMVAGHMLLTLCFLATNFFFVTVLFGGNLLGGLGVVTLGFGIVFTVLELFIGGLQAYVFAILTAIYIQMALSDEH
ncbi:F0F1 ATP synthase subunit A [soil metagenome]